MRTSLACLAGIALALPAAAVDLVVKANETATLPSGQQLISYDRLILGPNASLVIPEGTSKLTLRAEYFVAEAGAHIYQYAARRAGTGGPGSTGAQGGRGEAGLPGGTGQTGARGRDSVDLTLQLGIAVLEDATITLASQAGGHGGAGGTGGEGGESGCSNPRRDGGPGGTGGTGGTGGQPGAAGPLKLVWWGVGEPVSYFSSGQPIALSVILVAGQVGFPAAGGRGGDGGASKSCFLMNGTNGGAGGPGGLAGDPTSYQDMVRAVEFVRIEVAP